ncbi:PDR/VanB family oxidoreductase [Nocardioides zeae]|uniref:Ferredoxin-NADP reductase n=1 Tax=Nocardioides zeae TaxID=1457234 RepID=A0AAJ1U0A4_9ACTN|nr:PDR/VanB family oxidoreductase [Nocardioides zeae]MDQ1105631.1 ferredoxin-NADP reductase [Nocardioides zeae]
MSATSQKRWTWAVVDSVRDAATGVREIALRYATAVPGADPGSHIDVRTAGNDIAGVRSYSIVRVADRRHVLVLGVNRADRSRGGSARMHSLRAGDRLATTQPLNNFDFATGGRPVRFLAGGIGITALYGMAARARSVGDDYTLTYVGRERDRMAFLADLEILHRDRMHVHCDDRSGRFDVAGWVRSVPRGAVAYLCGPLRLMDAVREAWRSDGRHSRDLRLETFGASGRFANQAFTVRVPAHGVDLEVPAERSILEALEDAGLDMMFDCRKGECGLCQVKVLGHRGEVDHRDVFLDAAQHDAARLLCTCVTRLSGPGAEVTLELP